jgi:hypothetical protein
MEISIKRNYGTELILKAENVHICEDIEERIYGETEDGRNVRRDVKTEVIEQFVAVLDDMICYREAKFNSSSLIERLFEKLPQDVADKLLIKLNNEYGE